MNSKDFDKVIKQYTELMIEKINQVGNNWQKPWFSPRCMGIPQNLSGRHYQGINSVMLTMEMEKKGYETPVFMTAIQASMEHVKIMKDEKPVDVVYWKHDVQHKGTGEKIPYKVFSALNKEEKQNFLVTSERGVHHVYNIQQTNYPQIQPELWNVIKNKFKGKEMTDENGMYKSPLLDTLLKEQKWICPITTREEDLACYLSKREQEIIIIPEKGQFLTGEDFYATLLHEMAHSTGDAKYLNRNMEFIFGSKDYAREELIAELTSAICGKELGIFPNIREENAMYLKRWLIDISDNPEYLFSILTEVGKASYMIKERLNEMNQYMSKEDRFISAALQENKEELIELKNTGFVPTLREMDNIIEQCKDMGPINAIKEIFNIDICVDIEDMNIENNKNQSRDFGMDF